MSTAALSFQLDVIPCEVITGPHKSSLGLDIEVAGVCNHLNAEVRKLTALGAFTDPRKFHSAPRSINPVM